MNPRNRGSRLMRDGAPAPAEREPRGHLPIATSAAVRCIPASHSRLLPWRLRGPRLWHRSRGIGGEASPCLRGSQPRASLTRSPNRLDRRGGRERLATPGCGRCRGLRPPTPVRGDVRVAAQRRTSRTVSCSTRSRRRGGVFRTATTGSRRRAAPGVLLVKQPLRPLGYVGGAAREVLGKHAGEFGERRRAAWR
jgi:hypothetical protein